MKTSTKDFLSHLFGITISVTVLLFGLFADGSKQIIQDPAIRVLSSFLLSVFILLVTDKLSLRVRESNLDKFLSKIHNHIHTFPISNLITEFHTSDDAMSYLCHRIPFASAVLNTRISKDAIPPERRLDDRYSLAIKKGLRDGLSYKEIISSGFSERSDSLKEYANNSKGTYFCSEANFEAPSFMNFIILEYKSGETEVIFGWATSRVHGTEQKAYKIVDTRVISYYQSFWDSLNHIG